MNIKFIIFILMLEIAKLSGSTIDGALFRIDDDSLRVNSVSLAPNEIRPKKEPPLAINSITYLCTIGNVYAIFREGNVGRSDPVSPESEVIDTLDLSSNLYRFASVLCIENKIFIVGIHIQQMEYRESIKNSSSIYISFRSRSKKDLIDSLDLVSKKLEIGFDAPNAKMSLHESGFKESFNNIIKIMQSQTEETTNR